LKKTSTTISKRAASTSHALLPSLPSNPLSRFADALFARASAEFHNLYDDQTLRALAADGFEFLNSATDQPIRVRVFNPDRATNGWRSPFTVIEVTLRDRPFILDTIRELLDHRRIRFFHVLHPILSVSRGADKKIISLQHARPDADSNKSRTQREAFLHWEIERISDPQQREQLGSEIVSCLGEVILATDDFPAMQSRVREVAQSLAVLETPPQAITESETFDAQEWTTELHEIREFLDWLLSGVFIFLGYRCYDLFDKDNRRMIRAARGSGLGILRREDRSTYAHPVPLDQIPADLRARIEGGPLLLVAKTNSTSVVHRRVPMDYIGIKKLDASGRYVGEHRFLGLFTSQAHKQQAAQIPVLRRKLHEILAIEGALENTHDHREIVQLFNSFPKELLFESNLGELHQDIRAIMKVFGRDEARIHIRPHPMRRGIAAIITMPHNRYSDDVRIKLQRLLEKSCRAALLEFHLVIGEHDQTRLHFTLAAESAVLTAKLRESLQRQVDDITRTWSERLRARLAEKLDPPLAITLHSRYADAFPPDYTAVASPAEAAADVERLEQLRITGRPQISMLNGSRDGARFTLIKFYFNGAPWLLSEIVPFLNNFGLRVIEQVPVTLRTVGEPIHIQQFFTQNHSGEPLDLGSLEAPLSAALLSVITGEEDDGALNALVVSAGLSIREVDLLRTYRNFAFQINSVPTRHLAEQALIQNPQQAREFFEIFRAKFDPDEKKYGPPEIRAQKRLPELRRAFLESVRSVENIAHDRILKGLLNLLDATVRTNFFQQHKHPIALKFDCARIDQLPAPRPFREIYVHSARLDGCHLRAGKIARGGLRYSDRHDDFRTEILGLMKTQKVKNAPIVPTGAKGGFVIRPQGGLSALRPPQPPSPADDLREQYISYIRALLDVTDNIVDGKIIPPPRVVRYDDDDPYLVVAADKGTAHLSDTANKISLEYNHWLGDAFASGGSQGYDHKALGITARGGWECVKRHFRELGKDTQKDTFTAIGIGSPDGDVFGNGSLQSRKMKLLAAFSHKEIFLDPNPDPETAFRERERLFRAVKSWNEYDPKLISKGGGVFKRQAKEIKLSPEARAMLGVKEEILDGESLIRAILKMKADLLWNGGIGTYVKASTEKHADAADSANDSVRVNPPDLHVTVVGEGGNLGFTQLARIEFAMLGGHINTDFIDNSAGVETSDHEVNLKILLQPLVRQGRLSNDERNRLLRAMTHDVCAAVLRTNFTQSLALALDQIRSQTHLDDYVSLMRRLEEWGALDRALERLPGAEDLQRRAKDYKGLTRPELSVLLATSKIWINDILLTLNNAETTGNQKHDGSSVLPASSHLSLDDPALDRFLLDYFPRAVVERFPEAPRQHPLRRNIIATQLVNEITDAMGCAFVHVMATRTQCPVATIIKTWLNLWEKNGYRAQWNDLLEKDRAMKLSPDYAEMRQLQDKLSAETQAALR
jgi:glutamate dehydrogenase